VCHRCKQFSHRWFARANSHKTVDSGQLRLRSLFQDQEHPCKLNTFLQHPSPLVKKMLYDRSSPKLFKVYNFKLVVYSDPFLYQYSTLHPSFDSSKIFRDLVN